MHSIKVRLTKEFVVRLLAFWLPILILASVFRLKSINFGLPHSFHADEPEIAELAIKYTFEFRAIVSERAHYKLIPINFVYGTVPVYYNTLLTMFFSKSNNVLGLNFSKMDIYVFLRVVNALFSLVLIPTFIILYNRLFNNKNSVSSLLANVTLGLLLALNFKFIVHAHYLNVDLVVAVFLGLSFLTMFRYYRERDDTVNTILSGILVGLAFGTKVTALLGLPLYIFLFLKKKQIRHMFGFLFSIVGTFIATNPFSWALMEKFAFRTYMLTVKENGFVFDSVDLSPFKYIVGLGFIVTPLILVLSALGATIALLQYKKSRDFQIFLIGQVLLYLLFYSLGTRRVDRWLLPIVPIVLMYSTLGVVYVQKNLSKLKFFIFYVIVFTYYAYFAGLTFVQYQRYTPKANAYLYMRDNVSPATNKLAITKEGLDPLNKLEGIYVHNFNVYESDVAQFEYPPSPIGYDYVILSSKPMQHFKNKYVEEKFPFYTKAWYEFENTITSGEYFYLEESFTIPKPNLIEVSDVYIYKSL